MYGDGVWTILAGRTRGALTWACRGGAIDARSRSLQEDNQQNKSINCQPLARSTQEIRIMEYFVLRLKTTARGIWKEAVIEDGSCPASRQRVSGWYQERGRLSLSLAFSESYRPHCLQQPLIKQQALPTDARSAIDRLIRRKTKELSTQ
jgi:hypothetical protein